MARPQQATQEKELHPHLRGPELLDNPALNKGTAFTPEERREYGLEGLLPHGVETIESQLYKPEYPVYTEAERRASHAD
jgi:hypothetical protein